jgi:hypothetical protein
MIEKATHPPLYLTEMQTGFEPFSFIGIQKLVWQFIVFIPLDSIPLEGGHLTGQEHLTV